MWEVITCGEKPYAEKNDSDVKTHVISNGRLENPKQTPSEIFELMKVCWYTQPKDKPVFKELDNRLRMVINGISRFPMIKNRTKKYRYW